MISFFLSGESIRDGDNDDDDAAGNGRISNNTRSPGRGGGHRERGHFFNDDETDEVLQDARDKLREGLRLGGNATAEHKLSPRRLFEYLDPDGIGEVKGYSMGVLKRDNVFERGVAAGSLGKEPARREPVAYFQKLSG